MISHYQLLSLSPVSMIKRLQQPNQLWLTRNNSVETMRCIIFKFASSRHVSDNMKWIDKNCALPVKSSSIIWPSDFIIIFFEWFMQHANVSCLHCIRKDLNFVASDVDSIHMSFHQPWTNVSQRSIPPNFEIDVRTCVLNVCVLASALTEIIFFVA